MLRQPTLALVAHELLYIYIVDVSDRSFFNLLEEFDMEELVKVQEVKVLPSVCHQILLELQLGDRVRVLAEHGYVEILDHSVEDDLVLVHLLLVISDVDCAIFRDLLLHVFKDRGQVGQEENCHADVLVLAEHSVAHLGLHHPIKHFSLVLVRARALEAPDEHQGAHVDPALFRVQAQLWLFDCALLQLHLLDILIYNRLVHSRPRIAFSEYIMDATSDSSEGVKNERSRGLARACWNQMRAEM